jgi:predicted nucleotidyltransferase
VADESGLIKFPKRTHNVAVSPLAMIESKRDEVAAICRRYGVRRLRLFGSAVRADWNPEKSDLDFLAEFGPPPQGVNLFDQQFGLLVDLERLFGRSVDVVDWNAAKKPIFRQVAEAEARELYAA